MIFNVCYEVYDMEGRNYTHEWQYVEAEKIEDITCEDGHWFPVKATTMVDGKEVEYVTECAKERERKFQDFRRQAEINAKERAEKAAQKKKRAEERIQEKAQKEGLTVEEYKKRENIKKNLRRHENEIEKLRAMLKEEEEKAEYYRKQLN